METNTSVATDAHRAWRRLIHADGHGTPVYTRLDLREGVLLGQAREFAWVWWDGQPSPQTHWAKDIWVKE